MKLSTRAWRQVSPTFDAIKQHPFNRELIDGSLSKIKFACFLDNDVYHLKNFARCLGIIARKAHTHQHFFWCYDDSPFKEVLDFVHFYFKNELNLPETKNITRATKHYSDYLLRTTACEPVEIAIAAILPCFWIYRELGFWIVANKSVDKQHPFARWIETYSSESFSDSVDEAIQIFDETGRFCTHTTQQRMLDSFVKSTYFEWHFLNDAYHQVFFDNKNPHVLFKKTASSNTQTTHCTHPKPIPHVRGVNLHETPEGHLAGIAHNCKWLPKY